MKKLRSAFETGFPVLLSTTYARSELFPALEINPRSDTMKPQYAILLEEVTLTMNAPLESILNGIDSFRYP